MDFLYFSGEDELSERAARRCVSAILPQTEFVSIRPSQGGRAAVLSKVRSYVDLTNTAPVVICVDLDSDTCAPSLHSRIKTESKIEEYPGRLVLCVAVREVEAWLLADFANLARFLDAGHLALEDNPETLADAKRKILSIAYNGRRYRNQICPAHGSIARVGPEYNVVLGQFVDQIWQPLEAAKHSASLDRLLKKLQHLHG